MTSVAAGCAELVLTGLESILTTPRIEATRRYIGGMVEARRTSGGRRLLVGLVGRGIQASRTPRMHELEGMRIGLDYTYLLIDFDTLGLSDEDLAAVIDLAEQSGFAGLNVTFPFKQAVVPLMNDLALEAAGIGAVNTVVFEPNGRMGHNTDAWGFAESLREGLVGADLSSVVQFGAGGAGAAVGHALLSLGTQRLTLCETDPAKGAALAERLSKRFSVAVTAVVDPTSAVPAAAGVVNTTPVGMDKFPGLPFDRALLRPRQWVADVIYFPPETELVRCARALGCRTLPGSGMAVYQAVKAFELFTGIAPDRAAMTSHFRAAA
jgi:shikimate dehydrogenase